MLRSDVGATPDYKQVEKAETQLMERNLGRRRAEALSGLRGLPSILTRPANPMGSTASVFLWRCLAKGSGFTEAGDAIRIIYGARPRLFSLAPPVLRTCIGGQEVELCVCSDSSAVIRRYVVCGPVVEAHLTPLALRLRPTIELPGFGRIKQTYRQRGADDGGRSLRFGDPDRGPNLLRHPDFEDPLVKAWRQVAEIEIAALLDYASERPIRIQADECDADDPACSLNPDVELPAQSLAFLRRPKVQGHDRHLGHLPPASCAEAAQSALELTIAAHLRADQRKALGGADVQLLAGTSYSGSKPRLALDLRRRSSWTRLPDPDASRHVLEALEASMAPVLARLHNFGSVHKDKGGVVDWVVARASSRGAELSAHGRLAAMNQLRQLTSTPF